MAVSARMTGRFHPGGGPGHAIAGITHEVHAIEPKTT